MAKLRGGTNLISHYDIFSVEFNAPYLRSVTPNYEPTTPAGTSAPDATISGPGRSVWLCGLALVVSVAASAAAHLLLMLIGLITNLSFFGRVDPRLTSPATHSLGPGVVLVPVLGSLLIVLLARWGTRGILGHGIPEVMEQVLVNRSRIAPRVALLKPIGSALSIGTGGPYGAEGPVIATGSALGSLIGQTLTLTAIERKVLLSAGAAAAMTAVFGSPVAATLLAVELLLFEFKASSLVPVMLAASLAQAIRIAWMGGGAVFPLGSEIELSWQTWPTLGLIGLLAGTAAVGANTAVHGIETVLARYIRSWMLRPVLGGLTVGLIGLWQPHVFGASYDVISELMRGDAPLAAMLLICGCKLAAWIISLGSGTSGGTLAPMLIAGGGVGLLANVIAAAVGLPSISPALAALAGMIAFFAGGSHAFIASIILGVELTGRAAVLWPLATAATIAILAARMLSRHSIMTNSVVQRGVSVPVEMATDAFAHMKVSMVMEPQPPTVAPELTVRALADRIGAHDPSVSHHQALILADDARVPSGIITRRDLLEALAAGAGDRPVAEIVAHTLHTAFPDEDLNVVLARMFQRRVGRLPVVSRDSPHALVGYLGRSAILTAHSRRHTDERELEPGWWQPRSSKLHTKHSK